MSREALNLRKLLSEDPFPLNLVAEQEQQDVHNGFDGGLTDAAHAEKGREQGNQRCGRCQLQDTEQIVAGQGTLVLRAEHLFTVEQIIAQGGTDSRDCRGNHNVPGAAGVKMCQ